MSSMGPETVKARTGGGGTDQGGPERRQKQTKRRDEASRVSSDHEQISV